MTWASFQPVELDAALNTFRRPPPFTPVLELKIRVAMVAPQLIKRVTRGTFMEALS